MALSNNIRPHHPHPQLGNVSCDILYTTLSKNKKKKKNYRRTLSCRHLLAFVLFVTVKSTINIVLDSAVYN